MGGTATTTFHIGNWYGLTAAGATTTDAKYYYFGTQYVAMRQNGGTTIYLHSDHLGSTRVTSGALNNWQIYKAYGAARRGGLPRGIHTTYYDAAQA